MDALSEEVRQRGVDGQGHGNENVVDMEWIPPPVAVMPLGTGNDLARCLGWGGGYAEWRHEGPSRVLAEVSQAAVGLLDRWKLTFTEEMTAVPGSTFTASSALHLLSPRGGGSSTMPPPPRITTKAMNNYLGVGVDAKVALEFHELREAYPQWFQSQLGNKLLYTGVGALDIVGVVGGGHLDLSSKVKIECDGEDVALPEGAEGLLVVNIPSYMGGVDLWASSRDGGSCTQTGRDTGHSGGVEERKTKMKASGAGTAGTQRKQSLCDGWVEFFERARS